MNKALLYWDNLLTVIVRLPGQLLHSLLSNKKRKPSLLEQSSLLKRLSLLLRSGLPIGVSLKVLTSENGSDRKNVQLGSVVALVESGIPFSLACERGGYQLSPLASNLVKVGEMSGTLPENLEFVAAALKQQHELRTQIIQALIYPAIIILATVAISVFLVTAIFPKIIPILKSVDGALPWSTQTLMGLSTFLTNYWLELLAAILVGGIGFLMARRLPVVAYQLNRLEMRMPLVRRLTVSYQVSTCCRTLGVLLANDVRIGQALSIVSRSSSQLLYKEGWEHVAARVVTGQSLSSGMNEFPQLFPPLVVQMTRVGETTGSLSHILGYIAEMYESDVREFTKSLTSILEPLLMLFMGLVVGFIAISIITPIYGITSQLHS